MRRRRSLLHIRNWITLFPILVLTSCSGEKEITGTVRTTTIIVDGREVDWNGVSTVRDSKDRFTLSVCYDSVALYLCLRSRERSFIMLSMMRGMTVWIDGSGGTKRNFGVRFPIGGSPSLSEMYSDPDRDVLRESGMEPSVKPGFEMELIGPKEHDRFRTMASGSDGIIAAINTTPNNGMIYELRVPLHRTDGALYAVNASDGENIGIGIETGNAEPMQRPSGDIPTFGIGGGGGPMIEGQGPPMGEGIPDGEKRGGPPPGMKQERAVNEWFIVTRNVTFTTSIPQY